MKEEERKQIYEEVMNCLWGNPEQIEPVYNLLETMANVEIDLKDIRLINGVVLESKDQMDASIEIFILGVCWGKGVCESPIVPHFICGTSPD